MFHDEYLRLDRESMKRAVSAEDVQKAAGAAGREDLRYEDFLALLYGTYSMSESQGQFEICDDRSLGQVQAAIRGRGCCPVLKDWSETFGGVQP